MPSPFPGMNPYLEHPYIWHNFHGSFIYALRDALIERLRPHYFVQVDENVYLHELSAEERRLLGRPDVGISKPPESEMSGGTRTAILESPAIVHHQLAVDELCEPYLRILDVQSREVIAVIEMLSPSNKGSDREQYLSKRNRTLKSSTHFVEFDFLRAGRRMPDENVPTSDYAVMVSRHGSRPKANYWPIRLRDPIPSIPVPLRDDATVSIDPKIVLDRVYDRAGYDYEIYSNPIQPPLNSEDAAWAAELLKAARVPVS